MKFKERTALNDIKIQNIFVERNCISERKYIYGAKK